VSAVISEIEVPAREGRAVRVSRGQRLRISNPRGGQCADFFAFTPDLAEWLSPMHTWVSTRFMRPRVGDDLLSQRRRPLLVFDEDGADGVHDWFLAACDTERYRQFGVEEPHRSCAENLREAMRSLGYEIPIVPQPINFFTNTEVEADGRLVSRSNPVAPGAHVVLEAKTDVVCCVSACPFDLQTTDWIVNSEDGLGELRLDVLSG
jgi:uncharacterized protein YcgI (DUF1989 family)